MHEFIGAGYKVLYPVVPHHVEGLRLAYPQIDWVNYKEYPFDYDNRNDYEKDSYRFLPIRFAEQILRLPYKDVMRAKYDLYGFDWRTWKNKAVFNRHNEIEPPKGEYVLVNRFFGTDCQYKVDIKKLPELPIVEMRTLEGYSLFSWAAIIENATYIHTANSSILYLLEILELKAKEIHLYARKPIEPHFTNTSYIFTKDYVLHV